MAIRPPVVALSHRSRTTGLFYLILVIIGCTVVLVDPMWLLGNSARAQTIPQPDPELPYTQWLPVIHQRYNPLSVTAPNGKLRLEVRLNEQVDTEQIRYAVTYDGKAVVAPSTLALVLAETEQPLRNLFVNAVNWHTVDERHSVAFGQNSTLSDQYNAMEIHLREATSPQRELHLLIRLYDQGVALRYYIPTQPAWTIVRLQRDQTDFTFVDDELAYYQAGTEGEYQPMPLSTLPTVNDVAPSENPLTIIQNNGLYVTITEAEVVNYPRMVLARRPETRTTLTTIPAQTEADQSTVAVTASLPFQTPWRVLLVAERVTDLVMSSDLIDNLNPPSALADQSWIHPGTAMRIMKLTTAAARDTIDFAAAHGIDYVEFDAGWYELGYQQEHNPLSDATDVIDAIDMTQVINYANSKGVGVWLYVNQVALQRQLDLILPLYARWGVKGLKLGFVDGRSQNGINFVHEVVQKAAGYRLLIDVHDNYRPSGVSRTYPNLLTQEGVRGNEHFPGAEQQTILPFTRLLAGAADTTFAFYTEKLNVTRAHQLAAQIVFFSPLQFVLWYDSPVHYRGEPEIDLIGALPTVWDETVLLDGAIGEYITVARRKGADWFVGTLTDGTARTRVIALNFLEPERTYTARIYRDGAPTAVVVEQTTVTAATTLSASLLPSGGYTLWLSPLEK